MQQFSMGSALMPEGGGGGTPYDGLYGEAPPERGPFFRPQVYERKGISFLFKRQYIYSS